MELDQQGLARTRLVVDALGVDPGVDVGELEGQGYDQDGNSLLIDKPPLSVTGSGMTGRTDKNGRQQHRLEDELRRAEYLASFGSDGLDGRGDSYNRTGQSGQGTGDGPGYSFALDPSDDHPAGFGYDRSVVTGNTNTGATASGQAGEYYSSFSRSDRGKGNAALDRVHPGLTTERSMSSSDRTHLHSQQQQQNVIDSRLVEDPSEAQDRARLAALLGRPINLPTHHSGHSNHHTSHVNHSNNRFDGTDPASNSPGRVNSQGALAAYLLPDGGEDEQGGEFSPGGTESGVGGAAW
jgi:hypothetical protein